MSKAAAWAVKRLQETLKEHADAISSGAQILLHAVAENAKPPPWRQDVEKIRLSAHAIYQLGRDRLNPELYADERPTVDAELFVIRHEVRGHLQNILGRCHLVMEDIAGAPNMDDELKTIVRHARSCVEAVDAHRDSASGNENIPDEEETVAPFQHPAPAPREPLRPARILVADDSADSRELLGRFLGGHGHKVEFASTGTEALQTVDKAEFDIILLDLLMPAPNGFEVLKELRRQDKLRHTSVIIVSGLDAKTNASLGISLGAVEYLPRPVDLGRLRARVESCLERKRDLERESSERAAREAEREAELELGRRVQSSFFPPPRSEHGPLRIDAFVKQAMEIGGDCYFHHSLQPHWLLAGVADVTGKGWPAALDIARLTTLITRMAPACTPPNFGTWLVALNNALYDLIHAGENAVALTALLFDLELRRVHFAVFAAHPPLCRNSLTGAWRPAPCAANSFFGQRRLVECKVACAPLAAGSHWVIHSDGITEAALPSGSQFGREGLVEVLQSGDWSRAGGVSDLVEKWGKILVVDARDDATLMLIEDRTPLPTPEFSALCTPENIGAARLFFEQWGCFAGVERDSLAPILIGCDEILTNIIKHAYGLENPPGPFSCAVVVEPAFLRFVVRHNGIGLTQEKADRAAPDRPRGEGGRGLALVKRVFSRVRFSAGEGSWGAEIVLDKDFANR